MSYCYRVLRSTSPGKAVFIGLIVFASIGILNLTPAMADPPAGSFYYPPDNEPPGPPPNYNQVDTSYFIGQPDIPLPPPDSGGVYVWVDTDGSWNIASHIYSRGNSLEQFHGSVLAFLDSPPAPGVNVFATNFELWGDPNDPKCQLCYKQNDRWGWYQWAEDLYEIWWDVCTREWRQGDGDPNDFMRIMITGCAIDFNVWSSGHSQPFDTDQIFLGESMVRLSDVPGFEDTYPGITDPYQSQAGDDPTGDPNITIFTPIEGIGEAYNKDGIISPGQTYPCGPVLGQNYGDRFGGTFVYEGNGVQFSSACLSDPCASNNPPVATSPDDTTMVVCDLGEICLPGFFYSDPDGNLLSVEVLGGELDGETVCFTPVEGINTITLICIDACGAADTAVTLATVNLNSPPAITCPPDITIDCAASTDPASTGYATATDDNDPSPTITYSDVLDGDVITRTWVATDYCGSSSQCGQTITLEDTTPPTITCPVDLAVQCPAELPAPDVSLVTAADDCDPAPVVTHTGDASDGNTCPETITRTYRATDASGNFAECAQTITINDDTPPVITCPPDIAIHCTDPIDPISTGMATATDNCDTDLSITYSDEQLENIITRTWTATDDCDNTDQCVQTITIEGTMPPIAICPGDMTVALCDMGDEVCIDGFIYSDPDGNLVSVEVNVGTLEGETLCFVPVEGVNEIILTVTDDCGLQASCNTQIMAAVNGPPTITCIDDTTVVISDIEEICLPGIEFTDPDDNIVTINVTGGYMAGGYLCLMPDWGINSVTIVCIDSCGIADTCEINITVGCCEFTPGDTNGDGSFDLTDVTLLTNMYRFGTALPDTCDCRPEIPIYPFYGAADADGDCVIYTLIDVVYLIGYFRGAIEQVLFCPCCPPTGGWVSYPGGGHHRQALDDRKDNPIGR
jgi:hypothetical protein